MSGSIYIDRVANLATASLRLGDYDQLTGYGYNVYSLLQLLSASQTTWYMADSEVDVTAAALDFMRGYLTTVISPGSVDCISGSQFDDFVRGGYYWSMRTGSS